MVDPLKLFIKRQKEECLFCLYCGEQTLHMDSEDSSHFSCSDCCCDIYIYGEKK